LFFVLFLLITRYLPAQEFLVIRDILLSGNDRTRDYIVLNELDVQPGDTLLLKNLTRRFEQNRNRLLNTGLFNQVEITLTRWDMENHTASVRINLLENWFWYPVPVLELADRSFNEWFYQHDASLQRLNLGIRFMHINLSGNQDRLKATFHTGFTQKYELDYTFPYLSRTSDLGGYLNLLYVTQKEIPYLTLNNQLQFFRQEEKPLLNRFRSVIGLNYRKNNHAFHAFRLEFHHQTVADTISRALNPAYFQNGSGRLSHLSLNYHFLYTRVDKNIYPTEGFRFLLDARKDGLGVFPELNHFLLTTAVENHIRWNPWFSSGFRLKGRVGLSFGTSFPYAYQAGMGYLDDVLSGYQLYVMDGPDYAYIKSWQKIRLLDLEYQLDRLMPLRAFKKLPVKLYLGIHGDLGYARQSVETAHNPFNNRLLYGTALSLDLVVYENYLFSCELSVNHTGEFGLFFQGANTFE
jgi:hypothetical protein